MSVDSSDRRSILVVDDEAMIRGILVRALGRRHDVTAVESPQEALEALQAHAFDLVLTDINMPGGSGLDLAGTIRSERRSLPIAFITAVVDDTTQDRIEALEAPVFFKPFDLVELMRMVDALLRDSGQESTNA
ncbi:MAG: response regulator [Proteobacteria bacterium]|nr:response regulator [Pseudomonadota bacterium]